MARKLRCTSPILMEDGERCRSDRIVVVDYHCNHSAFSGYRQTPSAYSGVKCLCCGWPWRTKAKAVESTPMATPQEARSLGDGRRVWEPS